MDRTTTLTAPEIGGATEAAGGAGAGGEEEGAEEEASQGPQVRITQKTVRRHPDTKQSGCKVSFVCTS